jgi:hypothetical protein
LRRGLANASMNLNFCVKWLRQIASGGSNSGLRIRSTSLPCAQDGVCDCGVKSAFERGRLCIPGTAAREMSMRPEAKSG